MLIADSGGLTSAADEVEVAAAALADVDVAGPFADTSDALPGSATSQACLWVSTRLAAAVQVYAEGLGALADTARLTARDFDGTDSWVSDRFGGPR